MVLGTTVDLNVLSYPVLVIMKEQGAIVGQGGARPRMSGEAEPAVTPQCYGCTKTLASHEHVHYHLIHKHHTMMKVSFHVCFI